MKNKFPEYYSPTEKELEELWENCIFIFDTSVLLNLYEYSEKARDELLSILKKISDRIWIPFQIGKEYQSRRPHIIREQIERYRKIQEIINTNKKTLIAEIDKQKNIQYHPFIEKEELKKNIEVTYSNIDAYLKSCEKKYPDLIRKDNIGEEIDRLFHNKVGDEYSRETLKLLYDIAKKRYEQQIPPGFSDKQKTNDKQYGDYIAWNQIIEYSKITNKPVIFVTDDEKNDWWQIHEYTNPNQEIIAPHPELVKEFSIETNNRFYMYNSENFMKSFSKFLKEKVSTTTIKEVRNLRNQQFNRDIFMWAKQKPELLETFNQILELQKHDPKVIRNVINELQKQKLPQEFIDRLLMYLEGENYRTKISSLYDEKMRKHSFHNFDEYM